MCKATELSYNEQVLLYVVDDEREYSQEKCECGAEITNSHYERNDGGCINPYSCSFCHGCGYHDCNDDFCSRWDRDEEVSTMDEGDKVCIELEFLEDRLLDKNQSLKCIDWLRFKYILTNKSEYISKPYTFENVEFYKNAIVAIRAHRDNYTCSHLKAENDLKPKIKDLKKFEFSIFKRKFSINLTLVSFATSKE